MSYTGNLYEGGALCAYCDEELCGWDHPEWNGDPVCDACLETLEAHAREDAADEAFFARDNAEYDAAQAARAKLATDFERPL